MTTREPELIVRVRVEVFIRVVAEGFIHQPAQNFYHAGVLDDLIAGNHGNPPGTLSEMIAVLGRIQGAVSVLESVLSLVERMQAPEMFVMVQRSTSENEA